MKIEEYVAIQKSIREMHRKGTPEVLTELFSLVLFPGSEVKRIRLQGHTPGFNDGDPCCFSMDGWGFFPTARDDEDEDEPEEWWESVGDFSPETEALIEKFDGLAKYCSDMFNNAFGDSFRTEVTLDDAGKIVIQCDDYDCGY